jgi:hypothetical protein
MSTQPCQSCADAAENPLTALYTSGCMECDARALARSSDAQRAVKGITEVPLQQAMLRVFGMEGYQDGRKRVWAWMQRVKAYRAELGTGVKA